MTPDVRSLLIRWRCRIGRAARRRRRERLAAAGELPISVLFYHRVADSHPNPWTISTEDFARHVEYLREHFELIALEEVQRRVRWVDSRRPAASITFDDGYAENCRFALPVLIRYQIPCTYFVTLDHMLSGRPFAHDLQRGRPLPINTLDEVRALAQAGVEIGLHTRTHIDFSRVASPEVIEREIVSAAEELAALIGQPIRYFAFPLGMPAQLTQAAIAAVHRAGMQGFCSAFGGYNVPGHDAFHLRRMHGDPEFARLENWLSLDPVKLARQPRIRYFIPPHRSHAESVAAGL